MDVERRSERVRIDSAHPEPLVLERAGELIRRGRLVAFPTETVYGLGAHALDPDATDSIFVAKGRPSSDPLIVHVASVEQARSLAASWDHDVDRVTRHFWPGPLTVVVEKSRIVPDGITAGRPTVALRVPDHPVAHGLIVAADVPVAAPSANRFGRISPTTADAVESELGGRYDMLLDAGATQVGVESTVLDLTGDVPVVLRPGGVTVEQLREFLPQVQLPMDRVQAETTDAAAPGQFLRHYSPSTPLVAVRGGPDAIDATVVGLRERGLEVYRVDLPDDARAAANVLYQRLRNADGSGDVIVIGMVDPVGLGRAVNDRLFRASHGRVVGPSDGGTLDQLVSSIRDRTKRD